MKEMLCPMCGNAQTNSLRCDPESDVTYCRGVPLGSAGACGYMEGML